MNDAALHHQRKALERMDVVQRVFPGGDQVRELAGIEAAKIAFLAQ